MNLILTTKVEMLPKGNSEGGIRAQKKYSVLSPSSECYYRIQVIIESGSEIDHARILKSARKRLWLNYFLYMLILMQGVIVATICPTLA